MIKIALKFKDSVLNTLDTDKDIISIGRNISNDIRIDNLSVSKEHARIYKNAEDYSIEDLGSTNGTYLNEINITKQNIVTNDIITIGKHTLEITIPVNKTDISSQKDADDTMLLTTEKHKKMLEKQKKKNQ